MSQAARRCKESGSAVPPGRSASSVSTNGLPPPASTMRSTSSWRMRGASSCTRRRASSGWRGVRRIVRVPSSSTSSGKATDGGLTETTTRVLARRRERGVVRRRPAMRRPCGRCRRSPAGTVRAGRRAPTLRGPRGRAGRRTAGRRWHPSTGSPFGAPRAPSCAGPRQTVGVQPEPRPVVESVVLLGPSRCAQRRHQRPQSAVGRATAEGVDDGGDGCVPGVVGGRSEELRGAETGARPR